MLNRRGSKSEFACLIPDLRRKPLALSLRHDLLTSFLQLVRGSYNFSLKIMNMLSYIDFQMLNFALL